MRRQEPVKIDGLFLDYDGTISPLTATRQQSKVLPHTESLLNVMQKFVHIGVISTKDLAFILPRTSFAHAWAAIAGLELRIGTRIFRPRSVDEGLPYLNQALEFARKTADNGGVIEEKCDSTGRPLAFCVDWRLVKNEKTIKAMSTQLREYCRSLPLKVIEYEGKPYYDVFPCAIDKGQTLLTLKQNMGISGCTLYMGDSVTDNAAFKAVDVSIGVSNFKRPLDLDCQYWINFSDIAYFLSQLFKNQFTFSADLPGIRVRR
jgi:trehalose-phosphatase